MAKILIVDDDMVLARLYKSAFENSGHEVEVAGDGEEGFTKAKELIPSLILSDIMMPRTDGIELLKKLKAEKTTKDIPVVIMTNLRDEENVNIALKEGAVKHISKNEQGPKEVVDLILGLLN